MCSKILGERQFFKISSPLTLTFEGKKHCLLVIKDIMDYAWSNFLKEKSELKNVVLGPIKNLNAKYAMLVSYMHLDNAGKNVSFERDCKEEGMGIGFKYTA